MIDRKKGNGDLSQRQHSTSENLKLINLIISMLGLNILIFATKRDFYR